MSRIDATLRVVPEPGTSSRPSLERILEVARRLEPLGLEILHQGRFGVSVRAEPRQFEEALGISLPVQAPSVISLDPSRVHPALRGLVDMLEITGEPRLLSEP